MLQIIFLSFSNYLIFKNQSIWRVKFISLNLSTSEVGAILRKFLFKTNHFNKWLDAQLIWAVFILVQYNYVWSDQTLPEVLTSRAKLLKTYYLMMDTTTISLLMCHYQSRFYDILSCLSVSMTPIVEHS